MEGTILEHEFDKGEALQKVANDTHSRTGSISRFQPHAMDSICLENPVLTACNTSNIARPEECIDRGGSGEWEQERKKLQSMLVATTLNTLSASVTWSPTDYKTRLLLEKKK